MRKPIHIAMRTSFDGEGNAHNDFWLVGDLPGWTSVLHKAESVWRYALMASETTGRPIGSTLIYE